MSADSTITFQKLGANDTVPKEQQDYLYEGKIQSIPCFMVK